MGLASRLGRLGRASPDRDLPLARRRQKRLFRRQVKDYLEGDLKARLGLTDINLLSNIEFSSDQQNIISESRYGKVFLKVFPEDAAGRARLTVFFHKLMAAKGLQVPELVCHDTSRDILEKYGLLYLAIRFVPGTLLSADSNDDLVRQAFSYLADIHRVTIDDVGEEFLRELNGTASSAISTVTGNDLSHGTGLHFQNSNFSTLSNVVADLKDTSRCMSPEDTRHVDEFLRDRLKPIAAAPQSQVLLHFSFRPRHLIITPDGRMVTFDLDGAGFGGFYFDLVKALFNFGYKATSSELDAIEFTDLIETERFAPFLEAYFASAPVEAKELWQEHHATILLWGYLDLTRVLALRTVRSVRYGRMKRERTLRQVEQRWQTVVRYVRQAARST